MPRIPRIEEWPARYRTLFVVVMGPQEVFSSRAMK